MTDLTQLPTGWYVIAGGLDGIEYLGPFATYQGAKDATHREPFYWFNGSKL